MSGYSFLYLAKELMNIIIISSAIAAYFAG